jgi:hypothetical protein
MRLWITSSTVALLLASVACGSDGEQASAAGGASPGGSAGLGASGAGGAAAGTGGAAADSGSGGSAANAAGGGSAGASSIGGSAGQGGSGACSSTGFEPNGVKQIYASACDKAKPWVLGFDDWTVRATKFGTLAGTGAQTTVSASGQVRMTVKAEDSACEGATDQGKALAQGFMCSPNDWTNYELTAYLRVDVASSVTTDQDLTLYGGGGRHTGSGAPLGCMGSGYKGSYDYKQKRVRIGKESWHVNYDWKPWQSVPNGIDMTVSKDAWVGMKVIRYEIVQNAKPGVRNELWLDLEGLDAAGGPANAWVLAMTADDHPDSPSWGDQATDCGVPADDQILFWGGPWATFRWDGTAATGRLMSVREIVPPAP